MKLSFVALLFASCGMPPHVELPQQLPNVSHQRSPSLPQVHPISRQEVDVMLLNVRDRKDALFTKLDHVEYSSTPEVTRLLRYMTFEAVVGMGSSTTWEDFVKYRRVFDEIERLAETLQANLDDVRTKALQLEQELPKP